MGQRCSAPGCGRFVAKGMHLCRRHQGESALEDRGPPQRDPDELAERFRERLRGGDYRALLEPALWEAIASAGAERGLANEIGALRVVLARLLAEESDPGRLAQNAARVTAVLVQATRAQHALTGEMADGLAEAVTHILAEFGD